MAKERTYIPVDIRRELRVGQGHSCAVTFCTESSNLELHHIDGDPSSNAPENLIWLCANHHQMATREQIDAQECRMYKARILEQGSALTVGVREMLDDLKATIGKEALETLRPGMAGGRVPEAEGYARVPVKDEYGEA